jgi:hydrogenase maturation protease
MVTQMAGRVLVACVGNIFLGDDAFGVEMAQRLAQRSLPEGVTVVDFGIRSYDLAYALMDDWDLVILVDTLSRGGKPGTLYTLEPELPERGDAAGSGGFDAHTMNPVSVLQLVSALGGKCGRMLVVGCEPATVEPNADGQTGLSEPVRAAVEEAVAMVEQLIAGAGRATAA